MELDPESRRNDEHWRRQGLLNIKPDSLRFGEFPEGWDVVAALKRHVASLPHERIVDLGCGYGRLCPAFDPDRYLGLDINESAIQIAQTTHPQYRFRTVSYTGGYPPADIYLAYTVFLHISAAPLQGILAEVCRLAQWIVIAEILGSDGLDSGARCAFEPHAVYSRTKREYQELLSACGFSCWEEIRKPYYFYRNAEISVLIFRRDDPPPFRLDLPTGLRDPHLQFDGIYEDGWTEQLFSVRLSCPPGSRLLQVEGMLPRIDPQVSEALITAVVEGQAERQFEVPVGTFQLSIPIETEVSRPRIAVHCSATQFLPAPDGRKISALLKSVGFQEPARSRP